MPGYDPIASADEGEWFDVDAADTAVRFFAECLVHVEGELAGQPFVLEPWQQATVGCVFGWKQSDGRRRYREVFEFIPRKNGKTAKLAGLILLVGFCDNEPGAQLYSAAADREQASLVYRHAKGMLLRNPEMTSAAKIYATYKSIEFPDGIYKALSADADTKHGFNSHFVVVDELHAHPNRDLVDVLLTSTGARRQPLVWYITTADYDRESICNEKYDYAVKVRDGVVKDSAFLPVIYEAAEEDDWTSEATWRKANPNLDVSVKLDYLRRECRRAQETPTYENTFKRLHLNIRTQQAVRWIGLDAWDACDGPVDEKALAGRECYIGLDLASKLDLSAEVLLFPPTDDDPIYRILPRYWAPAENAELRERRDRVPYVAWGRQGFIELTPGNVVDYDRIKARIAEDARTFRVREIAYDPWSATQIALQLQDAGATCVEFGQGYRSMSEPTKEMERLIVSRAMAHAGHPVLRWNAANVAVETDPAGNIKPSKRRSMERIDGIVASIMALGRSLVAESGAGGKSVYEQRGMLIL